MEKFNDGRDSLLNFFIKHGLAAVELAEDCPALAYVAAACSYNEFNPSRIQDIDQIPKKKRTEILKLAGYLNEKWVAKLFRKIPISQCSSSFEG